MYKIVIVDDEIAELNCFSQAIDWNNYNLEVAAIYDNAVDAITYIKKNTVDVIISDIRMPGMDGIEFAKHIYEDFPNTIFILLSAHKDFEYARDAIRYGVFDYLNKPLDFTQIEELCKRLKNKLDSALKSWNKDDLSLLYCQQVANEFLSNKTDSSDELMKIFGENNIIMDYNNSPVAIINIIISHFTDYLSSVWSYGIDRLYSCLVRFLSADDISFVPLNYSFNSIDILAVYKKCDKISFDFELNKTCNQCPKICKSSIDIDIHFTVLESFTNLCDAKQNARNIIRLPKSYTTSSASNLTSISKAKEYINNNYSHDISLSEISKYVSLTPYHFCRLFKKETEENFSDYLNRIRIENAKDLLVNSNYKVTQILTMVGYNSKNYFYKMFKSYYDVTPQEYRNKLYNQTKG